jgi:NhaP-type Na+/H+ or K+/H+ antiporter
MHESGISILLFVIVALLLGSLIKALVHNSRLPYTVNLLLAGMILAGLDRAGWFGSGDADTLFQQIAAIDPHLILYLFLPTLIFESAFAMEPHLFFRIAPQIILLAIVGLIINMLLTALAVSWLLPWGFGAALLFGALISATDPVAVVALLKEKSSRKRLETLIEGESLLNDGTAIVFFSIFYGFALGNVTEVQTLLVIGEFIWVVSAGLLLGALIGWIALLVIGKMFNQPMIEISLSIGAAYLTFIAAEAIHVSGVVALVALALMFSTLGRTRISPEVSHFLHQFWEMMAYMANTLIFLIVGIVIVLNITLDSPKLWLILALLYLLVMLIRSASVLTLMPILSRIGIGINRDKATVLVWGGLRGAVSLSLALSLAQDSAVPEPLREQILFLTAGIVVLTIIINGTTMEWLLCLLKLDRLPPAKEASVQKAKESLLVQMSEFLKRIRQNPFFGKVGMDSLNKLITDFSGKSNTETEITLQLEDLEIAFMRRLLEIERSDYWRQFEEGYIGRSAATILSRSVEQALDNSPTISPRPELDHIFSIPTPPDWMHHIPMMSRSMDDWLFSRLSLAYDIARGFVEAQEDMRHHIPKLSPSPEASERALSMIDKNCTQAFAFTHYISEHFATLVISLQTRSAKRLLLNHERALIWKMQHDGVLEETEALYLIEHIEHQMAGMRKEKETSLG